MQTQDRTTASRVQSAIGASQDYLLSIQYPEAYWWAELESNVSITAQVVLLQKILGADVTGRMPVRRLQKVETYLRQEQRQQGGWELVYGDGGNLSVSVEAYMALKLLGVPESDPAMLKAGDFILNPGGISKTGIFTKLHLAPIGCYSWLVDSGLAPNDPAVVRGKEWLLSKQILDYGDWALKNQRGKPGGLAFEFDNRFYPDVDDTAYVVNPDGGWGETCHYNDPALKGQGASTASQTAWGLMGLMAATQTQNYASCDRAIERGVNYLLATQHSDGTWNEAEFTGTGFPCHFFLLYHYQQHFPLTADGRYQAMFYR